jgi:hypothetical protein
MCHARQEEGIMADRDREFVGSGDVRLDEDMPRGGASMPGTPGYESEAAYRHREASDADIAEIRTNQLAPGPLRETTEEPMVDSTTLKWNQTTRHHSK